MAIACGATQFTGEGSDASIEGASADGTALDGSTLDASDSGPTVAFCTHLADSPFFCADFDESDLHKAYSGGVFGTSFADDIDGGSISDDGGGRSLPNALLAQLADGPLPGHAIERAPFAPTGMKVHYVFELDFRLESAPSAPPVGGVMLFSLQLGDPGSTSAAAYGVAVTSSGLSTVIADPGSTYTKVGSVPNVGVWTHARIDVNYQTSIVLFAIEGLAAQKSTSVGGAGYQLPKVSLGLDTPGGTEAFGVSYDNVLLRVDDITDGG